MTGSITPPSSDEIIDVAIIGGGVSGAYTAYRLKTSEQWEGADIRLFEMSDRIGGRLWSIHLPGLPNLPAELGGMAFSRLHCNVYGLCEQLGLEIKDSDLYTQEHLQYFRGHHFWADDYKPQVDPSHLPDDYYPNKIPFFLEDDEKGQPPIQCLIKIFNHIPRLTDLMIEVTSHLKELGSISSDNIIERVHLLNELIEFLRIAKLDHDLLKPKSRLSDYGFWNVMINLLSADGFNFLKTVTPLHSTYGNSNLYDFMLDQVHEIISGSSYHALKEGYDALPKALVSEFCQMGGIVNMRTQLFNLQPAQVDYYGKPLIKLTVGSPTEQSKHDIYARNVVLALPQRALKLLFDCNKSIFDDQQLKWLDAVTAHPAYKLILAYDHPWWERIEQPASSKPITTGCSFTDLPLQACYYVGQEKSTGYSLLIASLGDDLMERFWSGLGAPRGHRVELGVTSKMVREAQWQLKKLHQIDIPDPVHALFWDWKNDPFGGGWHYWNLGLSSWEVAPKIAKPNPEFNIFVCGEAYSTQQGWVEGAINSAEMVLSEHFNLPRPEWVPENYRFDF